MGISTTAQIKHLGDQYRTEKHRWETPKYCTIMPHKYLLCSMRIVSTLPEIKIFYVLLNTNIQFVLTAAHLGLNPSSTGGTSVPPMLVSQICLKPHTARAVKAYL